jgi:hypothetical protein
MVLSSAPITAHAASFDYRGGCGFDTLNDTTPGGQLGGQDVWNGGVYLAVVPTDTSANKVPTGATAAVSCELKVNGVSQGTVLGPVSGTGFVAAAGTIQFTAAVTDVVSLCDHVTVGSETIVVCGDATTTQIVPQPIVDAIDAVITLINDNVLSQIDPTICPVLASLAPGAGPVIINSEGDVYIGSTNQTDKWYDCPPYGDSDPGEGDALDPGAGVIIVQGLRGGNVRILSNGASCDPPGTDHVKCQVQGGPPKCDSVHVEAHLIPDLSSTVTGTMKCGTLQTSAAAGPTTPNAENTANGSGVHPLECAWALTGNPIGWGVNCSYTVT